MKDLFVVLHATVTVGATVLLGLWWFKHLKPAAWRSRKGWGRIAPFRRGDFSGSGYTLYRLCGLLLVASGALAMIRAFVLH
jgi:hypothetical protein